jgi:basic membrane lipoprotein Med (substrate-binding protein (PBP1-ABC) superfamily)
MSNYFGRTYEPRFLSGIIAGALTKSNIVGYTATESTPEVVASINAFALGMKLVNPASKLLVTWTGVWNNPSVSTDISHKLIDLGADMISNKNLIVPRDVTWDYGVYAMLCDIDPETKKPVQYFASPIWKWGKFYEKIIHSILNGTYQRLIASDSAAQKIVNFWWGMDSGVLDLYVAEALLPTDTVKLVNIMKKMIMSEQYHPFIGPIYDGGGVLRISKDSVPSPEEIMSMDWFVDGVSIIE